MDRRRSTKHSQEIGDAILDDKITLSEREMYLTDEITRTYNAGDCKLAVEKSIEFLNEFPKSYMARYKFAVMHGDYSYTAGLSFEDKKKYRLIGNYGIKDLAEDPDLKRWPKEFQSRLRNEYYWFFEMPLEQYKLGLEDLADNNLGGHYSATVGAAMLALKSLKSGKITTAEEWAKKSIEHFKKFEDYKPTWANINYFAAQSFACLGKYADAVVSFKDMYRKLQAAVNETELADFITKLEEIKSLRTGK